MNLSYLIGHTFFRVWFKLYFRRKVTGTENVPSEGPVLLAANHVSFLDPPMIGSSLKRDIHYLARKSLFSVPLVGPVIRSWNSVPVDRDGGGASGLRTIMDRLHRGAGIILFPEGTRSPTGELLPAQAGVGLIAVKSEVPVVPVRVFGAFEAFGRHMKFPRPRKIWVTFGKPLDLSDLRNEVRTATKARQKEIYQEASDRIMVEIAKLQKG